MDLTSEAQQAVERGQAIPISVGQTPCVIVRADVYQRVADLLELGEFDPGMGHQAFREAAGDEWDDPALDVYEQYRRTP